MEQFVRSVKRHLRRVSGVERFVRLIVGGGIALVAGLWLGTLAPSGSLPWVSAVVLVLIGVVGMAIGIRTEINR